MPTVNHRLRFQGLFFIPFAERETRFTDRDGKESVQPEKAGILRPLFPKRLAISGKGIII
jgi:hypothetical protein